MPIYEYKCKSCGTVFEKLVKVDSKDLILCPECGGETKKLISSAGLIFKGSGFYITDYAKKKKVDGVKPVKKEKTKTGEKAKTT